MLGLVAGTASFAQTTQEPQATISITNDQKVNLIVGKGEATAIVILRDAEGHILYSENVDLRNGIKQRFNIAELANGTYQLAVTIGNDVVKKTFTIDEQPAQKVVAFRS